jgi:hypothetical protein
MSTWSTQKIVVEAVGEEERGERERWTGVESGFI